MREIILPKRLEADPDTLTYNYGKFVAKPLMRGFGITLGNSLRRVLLSSIRGAAITSVKIDGVLHEFSTIPSVAEDVVQIVLNLKEIRFQLIGDNPVTLYLHCKDAGEVTAADIQPNSRVVIMNPDQHIATLDRNGELKMEMTVESGMGYLPVEANKNINRVPGIIPIDAIFSPIRKVNFQVDSTIVPNQPSDFDKLTLEVWTDGSISAKDAVAQACEILIRHFNIFKNFEEGQVEEDQRENEELEKRKIYLSKPVAELELSVRAANCLAAANIVTIKDLVTKTEQEMLKYRNFGRKSLNEIKAILSGMGLSFGMVLDEDGESVKFRKLDTASEITDQSEEDLTDDDIDEEIEDDDIESEES